MPIAGAISRALCGAALFVGLTAVGGVASSATSVTHGSHPNAHKAAVVIGVIGNSALGDPELKSLTDVSIAFEKWTNRHGGIAGHPVDIVTMQDQGSQVNALQDVQTLVNQDHIVALAAGDAPEDPSFLIQNHVPYISYSGGCSYTAAADAGTIFTASSGCDGAWATIGEGAVLSKQKKLGIVYCAEYLACAQSEANLKKYTGSIPIVVNTVATVNAPDYTAQCLALKQSDAGWVLLSGTSTMVDRVAEFCSTQHVHPIWFINGNGMDNTTLELKAFNGSEIALDDAPWFATNYPEEQAFHSAMAEYFPADLKIGSAASPAWLTMDWASFEDVAVALELAHVGVHPTASNVLAGFKLFHNQTLGGIAPPLTYWKNGQWIQPTAVAPCSFYMSIRNRALSQPQGTAPVCTKVHAVVGA